MISIVLTLTWGGSEATQWIDGDQDRARAVYTGVQPLGPEDVAESTQWIDSATSSGPSGCTPVYTARARSWSPSIHWVASLPPHVNVNTIEIMAVAQSFAPFQIHRRPG